MFQPLSLYIGLRYIRSKRSNHFISFITLSSMLGIAIGVAVLITVLSVMNGFDEEIRKRFFAMAPEITVQSYSGAFTDWQVVEQQVGAFPGVQGVTPVVSDQGLLTYYGQVEPVIISGIVPESEQTVTALVDNMLMGSLDALQPGAFGIVLGKQIANALGLLIGDKVTVMMPTATVTPVGIMPRFKRFDVVGIFATGDGFGFESSLVFIHLADAQRLLQLPDQINSLKVRIGDIYAAPATARELMQHLPSGFYVGNWTQEYGAFFQTIQLEKTMMFLILTLIIAVATFNLVASLVMIVTDKQADIAILRTMGTLPRTIMRVFVVQGVVIGSLGTALGLLGGVVLSWNATEIVNGLQYVLNTQILASSVYFVDYLPSKIMWQDLVKVCCVALVLSLLATLYPAWRAARVQPAEALRYE